MPSTPQFFLSTPFPCRILGQRSGQRRMPRGNPHLSSCSHSVRCYDSKEPLRNPQPLIRRHGYQSHDPLHSRPAPGWPCRAKRHQPLLLRHHIAFHAAPYARTQIVMLGKVLPKSCRTSSHSQRDARPTKRTTLQCAFWHLTPPIPFQPSTNIVVASYHHHPQLPLPASTTYPPL